MSILNNYIKPFLDYYNKNNCVPVEQDISDLRKHYSRREALYRSLGIPSSALKDKDVLELGPGCGHNSIFTNLWGPQNFTFLDGSELAIAKTRNMINKHYTSSENCHFHTQDLDSFESSQLFDFVFCEGVIPGQLEPKKFAKKLSSFVKPGGVLVITCVDSISVFSELTRRVIAKQIMDRHTMIGNENISILKPVFEGQFQALEGMSRKLEDWIIDCLISPVIGRLFSIEDAISSLGDEFEFYGSSPDFVQDWRWYKNIYLDQRCFNEQALKSYNNNILNFLDYRVTIDNVDENSAGKLLKIANDLFKHYKNYQDSGDIIFVSNTISLLGDASEIIRPFSEITSNALINHKTAMELLLEGKSLDNFEDFLTCGWFGRGQQYLSFTRNIDY